jgi:EAL domain-containing protein (putative c-di-GMP-specific phosphodiesterase class I)/GGDEF domain-containing protein
VFLSAIVIIAYVVYATGGIKFVFSHSMYLPILLSGFIYGFWGGLVVAIIGGVVLGPYMPIDSTTGEMQETLNWVYRTVFFALVGVLSGVASDSVRAQVRKLEWDSLHDPKSGLRNRAALVADLQRMDPFFHPGTPFVLAVVSIDNIADLRTAFGVDVVDGIVEQLAMKIRSAFNGKVEIYRSSIERISALTMPGAAEEADQFVKDLEKLLQSPLQIGQVLVHVDASIGYVRGPLPAYISQGLDTLILEAEAAALAAHRDAQNSVHYDAGFMIAVKENLSLLSDLRLAMEEGELTLRYQPKVAMRSGRLCGVEALIRWWHPQRGWVSPNVFIPCAEQSTLIQTIVEFTLRRSLEQVKRWREQGASIPVAVNVSPRNLTYHGFVDKVFSLLDFYGIDGELLELEITEGALMTDMEQMIAELNRLAQRRVRITVDDFGTGYSSLQYLHRLPISHIKIDQSFVRRALTEKSASHIVEAAVSLAHRMGITTVGEGVEDRSTYAALDGMGCDIVQGFFVGHPLTEGEFAH